MDHTPSSHDLSAEFDELGLAKPKETGPVPKERLTSPSKLRSIHMQFREDDRVNAHNRALCQGLLDGEPPYDEEELANANQPDTTNLNFQGAEKDLEQAKAPYHRLFNSGESLVNLKTFYGPEDQRADWEEIMAEEITQTIRNSDEFPYQVDRLLHKYIWEGVAVAHWKDDMDWRFHASGQGQFYFPRQTAATESKQEIVTSEDEMQITELFSYIDREDTGEWDKDAVRKAIVKATNSEPNYYSWERIAEEVKNNDLFVGTKLPLVRVIHGFAKEFDGTVSHYIVSETDCGEKNFLFRKRSAYKSMTEGMVLFPYGSGTNTKLHGIRGLGYKVYPFQQQLNRSVCRLIDQGELASSLMLQADSETDYANLGLEYVGNLAALPPNFKVVTTNLPDLNRSVVPAIEMMKQMGNDRIAGYSPESAFDGSQRQTKFEVSAKLEQSAELSTSALNFFYTPADRLMQQTVRRMTYRNYLPQDPGGAEIADLRLRIVRQGVPLEAFYRIDWARVSFARVIGAGSAAARTLGLERMEVLRPRMDDVAQVTLDRELAIDAVGIAQVNKYFPRDGAFRTTVDTQIAILQNAQLLQGTPIPVLSSDKHLAHAREHIKPLLEMYEAVQGGQAPLAESALTHVELFSHTTEHVQLVEGDVAASEEAAAMRQMLQRVEEIISNGIKEAEAEAQKQAEQPAEEMPEGGPEGEGGPVMSQEQQDRFAKAQAEIEIMRMKAEAGIAAEAEKTQARIAMEDAKAAADIRRKGMTQ